MFKRKLYLITFFYLIILPVYVFAQDQQETTVSDDPAVPEQVDITPAAEDAEIRDRLSGILNATGWFIDSEVDVNDGVVFLRGSTESEDHKRWAGDLARNTQDVTAVVNQIEVLEPDIWNYEPAITGMQVLWHNFLRAIPFWIFGIVVLIIFWIISLIVAKIARSYFKNRGQMNALLQDITSKGIAVLVFLLGLYIVFYIADLTHIALTVLGGTGLLGIVLGIAFRDITENFLASIFLSLQNPFHAGDLVEINGNTGFIQRLTIRATLLMTLDGNHMQIPNSTVYKSCILNYSSNPNQRTNFIIGIGYEDSVSNAQLIGSEILDEHPAVLKEPEPWILLDQLAASTINLKFYFWVDGNKHNILKVKSSILRQVKSAYQKEGISMPDESRETIFPMGVPVQIDQKESAITAKTPDQPIDDSKLTTEAEGQLLSNDDEIREQARRSRIPEEGEDLLKR